MNQQEKNNRLFNNQFLIKKRISSGSFGVVFLCQDLQTKDYVAMKVEKENINNLSLDREISILEKLQGISGNSKIDLGWQSTQSQLSGPLTSGKRFISSYQVPKKIFFKIGIIHRDIKPENIMTGRDQEQSSVFLADFGISKTYRESDGAHTHFRENKFFVGTTRYASINSHLGYELSRRDDLESIGYVIIYLLKGSLPWSTIHCSIDKDKTKQVGQIKQSTTFEDLCKDCPLEFYNYFQYVRQLQFKSTPDYNHLISLFEQVAQQYGFTKDSKLDWMDLSTGTTRVSIDPTQGDSKQKQSKDEPFKTQKNVEISSSKKQLSFLSIRSDKNCGQKNISQASNTNRQRSRFENQISYSKNSDSSSLKQSIQQSSVMLNYQNSQFSNNNLIIGSHKRLGKITDRSFGHKESISRNSILNSQQSVKSVNQQSVLNQQLSQQNTLLLQNTQFIQLISEDFQDLEELEEKLKKEKKKVIICSLSKPKDKPKINVSLTVKEIQNRFDQSEQTDMLGMTQLEEDTLENKIKIYQLTTKMKQNLSMH